MWTYYRNGTVLKKKKDRENKDITFPAISNGPTSFSKDNKNKSHSQRVQDLFFSHCLSDHGIVGRKVRTTKKADNQWSTPFTKVNEEAESHIKAHLRYHLHQRHVKAYTRSTREEEKEAGMLHLLNTQGHLFKDKTLKTLLGVNGHEGLQDDCPEMLQSLVDLGQVEEDREEEKVKEQVGVRKNVDSWNQSFTGSGKRPPDGSSTGHVDDHTEEYPTERGPRHASHTVSDDLKGEVVPPFCAKKRRFMVYICGGYKDTVAERSTLMENVFPGCTSTV
ncbi:uncharacterized protein LOC134016750 [Osmerus eperlanus]|uniref:uncharacterized protein LOC134016750 n=1 Tax=Osmerus eperlanus TaxID=29151 RepID=UPI002E0EAACB